MVYYRYHEAQGRLLFDLAGRACLLDTGIPFCVGDAPVRLAGRIFDTHDHYLEVCTGIISTQLGTRVDAVLGANVLQELTVSVDPDLKLLGFGESTCRHTVTVPLSAFVGTPLVKMGLGNRIVTMLVDTGSRLSLLSPELLKPFATSGSSNESYPLAGRFTTPLYEVQACLGGQRISLECGRVPTMLLDLLDASHAQGIIGTSLLKNFEITLAVEDRQMGLSPTPRQQLQESA
jgi:hypothetical protein